MGLFVVVGYLFGRLGVQDQVSRNSSPLRVFQQKRMLQNALIIELTASLCGPLASQARTDRSEADIHGPLTRLGTKRTVVDILSFLLGPGHFGGLSRFN